VRVIVIYTAYTHKEEEKSIQRGSHYGSRSPSHRFLGRNERTDFQKAKSYKVKVSILDVGGWSSGNYG
jgi:hypothetical protein